MKKLRAGLTGREIRAAFPAKEAVIQLAFTPFAKYHAFPAQAGIHIAAGVALPEGARSQKTFKLRCLWKHGSRLFAGTAREVHCEIVNALVDAN